MRAAVRVPKTTYLCSLLLLGPGIDQMRAVVWSFCSQARRIESGHPCSDHSEALGLEGLDFRCFHRKIRTSWCRCPKVVRAWVPTFNASRKRPNNCRAQLGKAREGSERVLRLSLIFCGRTTENASPGEYFRCFGHRTRVYSNAGRLLRYTPPNSTQLDPEITETQN